MKSVSRILTLAVMIIFTACDCFALDDIWKNDARSKFLQAAPAVHGG